MDCISDCSGIFGVSIIVSISMSFFESVKGAQTDLTSLTDESQEKTLENGSPSSKIAVLEVSGTIQDNGTQAVCLVQTDITTERS